MKLVILCQNMYRQSSCHDWLGSGVTAWVEGKLNVSPCIVIHREMLASLKMSPEFNSILKDITA